MKKLKFILGIFVIGIGLMFTSFSSAQIFGDEEEDLPITNNSINIVESVNGSNITWSDSAINNGITSPIFMWLGSFINAIFRFRPVLVFVAFIGLILSLFYGVFNKQKDKDNKSLENK